MRDEDVDGEKNDMTHVIAFSRQGILRSHTRLSIYVFFGTELECWGLERFAHAFKMHERWIYGHLHLLQNPLCIDVLRKGNMWRMAEIQEQRFRMHMLYFANRGIDCKHIKEMLDLDDASFARRIKEML
jgi:hypothetical protein